MNDKPLQEYEVDLVDVGRVLHRKTVRVRAASEKDAVTIALDAAEDDGEWEPSGEADMEGGPWAVEVRKVRKE